MSCCSIVEAHTKDNKAGAAVLVHLAKRSDAHLLKHDTKKVKGCMQLIFQEMHSLRASALEYECFLAKMSYIAELTRSFEIARMHGDLRGDAEAMQAEHEYSWETMLGKIKTFSAETTQACKQALAELRAKHSYESYMGLSLASIVTALNWQQPWRFHESVDFDFGDLCRRTTRVKAEATVRSGLPLGFALEMLDASRREITGTEHNPNLAHAQHALGVVTPESGSALSGAALWQELLDAAQTNLKNTVRAFKNGCKQQELLGEKKRMLEETEDEIAKLRKKIRTQSQVEELGSAGHGAQVT